MVRCKLVYLTSLKKHFTIEKIDKNIFSLRYTNYDKPIIINLPFKLNENVATLAGMMPDASLIKDLWRVYFTQKKDESKVYLFKDLLEKLFSPKSTILIRPEHTGGKRIFINSQTLCRFLYHVLDFAKSDEQMKVPTWLFNSPESVKQTYLREVFAMEGSISKWPTKEITLVSKSKVFVEGLKKLLATLKIESSILIRIGGIKPQLQYKMFIRKKENILGFTNIGFTYKLHKDRFEKLVTFYNKK